MATLEPHGHADTEIVDTNCTMEAETAEPDTFMEEVNTYTVFTIAQYVINYWLPVLIPVGYVGNILSFIVMTKPNNRKMSTCIYMASISVNDNFMMSLALYNYIFKYTKKYPWHPLECRIVATFALFVLQNATYQVIAMTIDKFIAIKWPHKAATYSTSKRAKFTVIAVVIGLVIFNLPHLIISQVVGDGAQCLGYARGGTITMFYSWLNFVLNAVIPFFMLIYMNYVIIKKVRQSRRMFSEKERVENNQEIEDSYTGANLRRQRTLKNTENQLTIMLLLVTTLFLILMVPTYIRFLVFSFFNTGTPERYANLMSLYQFSYILYNTNSGINFFLYCISGQKFRNDVKETFNCFVGENMLRGKSKSSVSVTESSAVS